MGARRHVEVLCKEFGPRATGSPAERRAREYVQQELAELGYRTEVRSFRAISEQNWIALVPAALLIVSVAAWPWASWSNWLGVFLALSVPVLFWKALSTSDSPLRFLLPRVESGNVMASVGGSNKTRIVVVVSHLDSNRCRLAWREGAAKAIRIGTIATFGVHVVNSALLLAAAITGLLWLYLLALPCALYALGEIAVFAKEFRQPYSPGAHDNAASVAVNLELARYFAENPPRSVELRFLFTGAEEVDHRGIKEALSGDPSYKRAWFIVLEGLGSGQLCYLTKEGVFPRYYPASQLADVAEAVANRDEEPRALSASMVVVDEVQTLSRLGFPAICVAGRNPDSGSLPRWHTAADDFSSIDGEFLVEAQGFVRDLVIEINELEGVAASAATRGRSCRFAAWESQGRSY